VITQDRRSTTLDDSSSGPRQARTRPPSGNARAAGALNSEGCSRCPRRLPAGGRLRPMGCVNAFMQLAGTREQDRRARPPSKTAEQDPSMQSAWVILADRGNVGWIWCVQAQRSVRAVPVVVLDVDAQGLLEMIPSHDQQPVQTLGPDGATHRFCVGVRRGCLHRVSGQFRRPRRGIRRRSCGRTSRRGHAAGSARVVPAPAVRAARCGPAE
jgi:hypothetical protein